MNLSEPEARKTPFCRHFGVCGGCNLQDLDGAAYDAHKRQTLMRALANAGIAHEVAPLVDARGAGRRRATLHIRGKHAGYMRAKSHDLLDLDACPILVPSLCVSAPALARQIGATIGDGDASFTATATGLDIAVKARRGIKPERLTLLARQPEVARLTLNGEIVLQTRAPTIVSAGTSVEIPPGGFLQATARAEEILADFAVAQMAGAKSVADLFCGVGGFALHLARTARVYAADADKAAIAALDKAARNTKGLKPLTAKARDLFREPLVPFELAEFDAVVLDPPRAGAQAQVRELAGSGVKTIVLISCAPKTFARDAAMLLAGGYRLERVVPVDQFAWSEHVEVMAVLRRKTL